MREEYKRWIRRIETPRTKSQTSALSMSAVPVTTRTVSGADLFSNTGLGDTSIKQGLVLAASLLGSYLPYQMAKIVIGQPNNISFYSSSNKQMTAVSSVSIGCI